MSTNIHRAIVSYSNASTGEIKVRIPAKFDSNTTLDVSPIARSAVGGIWPVPAVNSQIVVASDDDSFTNIFWIQVAPDPATSLTAIQAQIDTKAPLLNPILTGTPSAPLAVTATNTTQLATTSFVQQEITALIGGAPTALNTLTELASAINNDASYATTLTTALALKAPLYAASPIGMITAYAGSTAPTNWLMCYGQTVSRTTYALLFAIISTTYNTGGEAGTDFRLPDLRGRTIAGLDNMGGTDAGRLSTDNTLGTTIGAETVTLTSAQSGVPAHNHANTAAFTGTAASHNHTQDAHNHTQDAHNHTQNAHGHSYRINITHSDGEVVTGEYLTTGLGYGTVRRRYADSVDGNTATNNGTTATNQSTTATNQSASITPAGNIAMTNLSNTAADAASAHSNMQPTMTVNYIILAGA